MAATTDAQASASLVNTEAAGNRSAVCPACVAETACPLSARLLLSDNERLYIQLFLAVVNRICYPVLSERHFLRNLEFYLNGSIVQTSDPAFTTGDCPGNGGLTVDGSASHCPFHASQPEDDMDALQSQYSLICSANQFRLQLHSVIAFGAHMLGNRARSNEALAEALRVVPDVFPEQSPATVAGLLVLCLYLLAINQEGRAGPFLLVAARMACLVPVSEQQASMLMFMQGLTLSRVEQVTGMDPYGKTSMDSVVHRNDIFRLMNSMNSRCATDIISQLTWPSTTPRNHPTVFSSASVDNDAPFKVLINTGLRGRGSLTALRLTCRSLLFCAPSALQFFSESQILSLLEYMRKLEQEFGTSGDTLLQMMMNTILVCLYAISPFSPFSAVGSGTGQLAVWATDKPPWEKMELIRAAAALSKNIASLGLWHWPYVSSTATLLGCLHTQARDFESLRLDVGLLETNSAVWPEGKWCLAVVHGCIAQHSGVPIRQLPLPHNITVALMGAAAEAGAANQRLSKVLVHQRQFADQVSAMEPMDAFAPKAAGLLAGSKRDLVVASASPSGVRTSFDDQHPAKRRAVSTNSSNTSSEPVFPTLAGIPSTSPVLSLLSRRSGVSAVDSSISMQPYDYGAARPASLSAVAAGASSPSFQLGSSSAGLMVHAAGSRIADTEIGVRGAAIQLQSSSTVRSGPLLTPFTPGFLAYLSEQSRHTHSQPHPSSSLGSDPSGSQMHDDRLQHDPWSYGSAGDSTCLSATTAFKMNGWSTALLNASCSSAGSMDLLSQSAPAVYYHSDTALLSHSSSDHASGLGLPPSPLPALPLSSNETPFLTGADEFFAP